VDFAKVARAVPAFAPRWTVAEGIVQLVRAFQAIGLTRADLEGPCFRRVGRVRQLVAEGALDARLRRTGVPSGAGGAP
jgi:hypothetical protein